MTNDPVTPAGKEQLRQEIFADVAAMLNDRVVMYEKDPKRVWPCEIAELKMLANAFTTYAQGVGVPSIETLRRKRDEAREDRDRLRKVVEYALHLRMYGEMAPGGNETWRRFDTLAEAALRGMHDAPVSSPREQIIIDRGMKLLEQMHPTLYKELSDEEAARKATD